MMSVPPSEPTIRIAVSAATLVLAAIPSRPSTCKYATFTPR